MVDMDLRDDPDILSDGEKSELEGGSFLDQIKAELEKEVRNAPITLRVDGRPGYTITFNTDITAEAVEEYRKRATDKKNKDKFDGLLFASLVVANNALIIRKDGKDIYTDDGQPLNFRNEELLEWFHAKRAAEAVQKLYGVDGHVFASADAILSAAGFSADGDSLAADEDGEDESDPTRVVS